MAFESLPANERAAVLARVLGNCVRVGDCLLFQGSGTRNGYGTLSMNDRKVLAHRAAYEATYGLIPPGLELDHVKARGCTSRRCCNPIHLEPVTKLENQRRGMRASLTHCPEGHPLSGENVRRHSTGRVCRTCEKALKRQRVQRRVASGLCRTCSQPSVEGRTMCAKHLSVLRERNRERRAK